MRCVVACLVLVACGRGRFDPLTDGGGTPGDQASSLDAAAFGPLVLIPGIDASDDERAPSIGTNDLELYYSRRGSSATRCG